MSEPARQDEPTTPTPANDPAPGGSGEALVAPAPSDGEGSELATVQDPAAHAMEMIAATIAMAAEHIAPAYVKGVEAGERIAAGQLRDASEQRAHERALTAERAAHERVLVTERHKGNIEVHKIESETRRHGHKYTFWIGLAAIAAVVAIFLAAMLTDKVPEVKEFITQIGTIAAGFFALFKLGQSRAKRGNDDADD